MLYHMQGFSLWYHTSTHGIICSRYMCTSHDVFVMQTFTLGFVQNSIKQLMLFYTKPHCQLPGSTLLIMMPVRMETSMAPDLSPTYPVLSVKKHRNHNLAKRSFLTICRLRFHFFVLQPWPGPPNSFSWQVGAPSLLRNPSVLSMWSPRRTVFSCTRH